MHLIFNLKFPKGQDVIITRWGIDTTVFNDVISNYKIKEGKGLKWNSVSDNEGNITILKDYLKLNYSLLILYFAQNK